MCAGLSSRIPFIITVGSHDKPESYFDKAGGDVLQILDARLNLVKRADTDQTPRVNIQTKAGKRVSIYGLGDQGREQEEQLRELRKHMTGDTDFGILLMHGTISGIQRMVGAAVDPKTTGDLLSERCVDYVAMGHNHGRWEHKDLQIYNPGSTEIVSFADATTITYSYDGSKLTEEQREPVEHGYYLEVTGEIINAQFQALPTRDVKDIQVRFDAATATGGSRRSKTGDLAERLQFRDHTSSPDRNTAPRRKQKRHQRLRDHVAQGEDALPRLPAPH